jgi:hypothetical protein
MDICKVDGCEDARRSSNGYCAKHYARWRAHGDPNFALRRHGKQSYRIVDDTTAAIPLTKGYEAIVDLEDAERVSQFPWIANEPSPGYVRAYRMDGKSCIFLHSFILGQREGNLETDHVDGNPLNNKKENLRSATHTENMRNTDRHRNRVGVSFNARAGLYVAYIDEPDKKRRYLGYCKTRKQAEALVEQTKCQ